MIFKQLDVPAQAPKRWGPDGLTGYDMHLHVRIRAYGQVAELLWCITSDPLRDAVTTGTPGLDEQPASRLDQGIVMSGITASGY